MDFLVTALIQGLAFCGLASGIFLSLRIFRVPDITTDGSYTTGGVIAAVLLSQNLHPFLVIPLCMSGGWLAGWTTGYVYTKLKVHPLLSGILVMTALYSVNLLLLGRPNLPLSSSTTLFTIAGNSDTSALLILLMTVLLLVAVLYYIFSTDFGIAMRATGGNEHMANAQGVHTLRMKRLGLALANSLTALSGCLIVQYQSYADINMGIGIVISGIAAVMTGETLLKKQNSLLLILLMCCAGSIIFRMLIAAALASGIDPAYLKLITSLLVLAIIVSGKRNRELSV